MGTIIFSVAFGLILFVGAFLIVFGKSEDEYGLWKRPTGVALAALGIIGAGFTLVTGTWLSNDVSKAQLLVDSVNRKIIGEPITTPMGGPFLKSPFADVMEFDLRQQELLYAGAPGKPPEWVGNRNLDGAEITVQVGGAKADIDVTVNYQLLPSQIIPIYSQYGSQQAFEIQVVKDQALSTIRQVPSGYTTNEFRGSKKGAAEQTMTDRIQERLKAYVTGVAVSIQEVRYPADIEAQLQQVEQSKQEAEKARADQERQRVANATAKEKAETDNAIKIATAKAEAEANNELAKSLTPAVLEAKRLEAINKAGTVWVVPDGATVVANPK